MTIKKSPGSAEAVIYKAHSNFKVYLFIGLGNPDKKYEQTRHNAGRGFLAGWCKKNNAADEHIRPDWNAGVRDVRPDSGPKTVAVLPNTMMNKSGSAVAAAAAYYKTKPDHIIVLHDDADIPAGRVKMSFGKRSAGHKGVESVIRALKTRDFWRIRIGIAGRRNIPAEKIVLKKWTPQEAALVKKVAERVFDALLCILTDGPEKAMMELNTIPRRKKTAAKNRR